MFNCTASNLLWVAFFVCTVSLALSRSFDKVLTAPLRAQQAIQTDELSAMQRKNERQLIAELQSIRMHNVGRYRGQKIRIEKSTLVANDVVVPAKNTVSATEVIVTPQTAKIKYGW